jgi:hypothetical protein
VRPNLAVLGDMEDGEICGSSMVQFTPIWGTDTYGEPPFKYKSDDKPKIMFIHMNLQKERGELTVYNC